MQHCDNSELYYSTHNRWSSKEGELKKGISHSSTVMKKCYFKINMGKPSSDEKQNKTAGYATEQLKVPYYAKFTLEWFSNNNMRPLACLQTPPK